MATGVSDIDCASSQSAAPWSARCVKRALVQARPRQDQLALVATPVGPRAPGGRGRALAHPRTTPYDSCRHPATVHRGRPHIARGGEANPSALWKIITNVARLCLFECSDYLRHKGLQPRRQWLERSIMVPASLPRRRYPAARSACRLSSTRFWSRRPHPNDDEPRQGWPSASAWCVAQLMKRQQRSALIRAEGHEGFVRIPQDGVQACRKAMAPVPADRNWRTGRGAR